MNFSYIRDNISLVLTKKYKGKLKEFKVEDINADISAVLVGMIKNQQIESFDKLKVYVTYDGVAIFVDVFLKFGKIHINAKVQL